MAGISNYYEDLVLKALLRGVNLTAPTNLYASAHIGDPGDTGANEVSAGNYARQAITFADPVDNGTKKECASNSDVVFPRATVAYGGGSGVTYFGVWTAASGGQCVWSGQLTTPKVIDADDQLKYESGDIILSLD